MLPKLRADIPKNTLPEDCEPRADRVIRMNGGDRTGLFQGWGPKL